MRQQQMAPSWRPQGLAGQERLTHRPDTRLLLLDRYQMLIVFGLALALRLLASALLADTYDADEFVVLSLSHRFSHGAVPYRDFMFFHPPGILVFLRLLDPLINLWWPAGRLIEVLVDSITATLVWRIGRNLYGRREAFAAGVLYALSPVAFISGARILQDPLMTSLGLAGLVLMLTRRSCGAAVMAGVFLGAAVWFKYPALVLLPIYALASPRRVVPCLVGVVGSELLLFAPFLPEAQALWTQTISWQLFHRTATSLDSRVGATLLFWLIANPIAVVALFRLRKPVPMWLLGGFGTGALFLFAAQVHYHYFVPVVPFAALLAAPLLVSAWRFRVSRVAGGILTLAIIGVIAMVGFRPTADLARGTRFSTISPAIDLLRQATKPHDVILADRLEYAYLTHRQPAAYFWNMREVVGLTYLTRQLRGARAIIVTRDLGKPSYPVGVAPYLNAGYVRHETRGATVWLTSVRRR